MTTTSRRGLLRAKAVFLLLASAGGFLADVLFLVIARCPSGSGVAHWAVGGGTLLAAVA